MSSMRRRFSLLTVLALAAVSCGGSGEQTAVSVTTTTTIASTTSTLTSASTTSSPAAETTTTTTTVAPLEPVEYVGNGDYRVGVATITVTDETRARPLTVEIWFPVGRVDDEAAPHRYSFITGDYYESPRAVSASAADAAPGRFPLVVYSHGSGGLRFNHSDFTETLAGHGYVVVAPDHTGNTAVEQVLGTQDGLETIALNRPLDVIAVIDAMTAADDPETKGWVDIVDPESVAVAGHSFGGYTTLAVAAGIELEGGTVAADERVDAIIPLAPASRFFSDEDFARIDHPMLILVGTADQSTPIDPNVTALWDASVSTTAYRAEFVDAAHASFSDVCDYLDEVAERPDANELVVEFLRAWADTTCSPPTMSPERVKELTNTLAVRFLDSVFGRDDMISSQTHALPGDLIWFER